MALPDNITREHILKAIQQINEKGIPNHYQSSTYDLIYEGLRYPPKLVFSNANYIANGLKLNHKQFHGGADTECFKILRSCGFEIISKEMSLAVDLARFLKQAETGDLKTRFYARKYQGLNVEISFGQGGKAKIPWISFLASGQTTSKGIYPVYLFYKEYQKLILAYGISETNRPERQWQLNDTVENVATYFSKQGIVPQRYGHSYVFQVYDTTGVLDYGSMEKDLKQIIREYNMQFMGAGTMEKTVDAAFSIEVLKDALRQTGLLFEDHLMNRFVTALLAKPFVILTGLAGSGKTKLAQAFAQWICQDSYQWCIVPVGADWTNREPLLGYPNALSQGGYVLPENGALNLMIEATKNPEKPYFLILDEMNLSHVERYFADFLSVMESGHCISLHPNTLEWGSCDVPATLCLPSNLFIVGTVNIDETTYMFSPKVLDRANVIEFRVDEKGMKEFLNKPGKIDLSKIQGQGATMAKSFIALAKAKVQQSSEMDPLQDVLLEFFKKLKKVGAEYGFRTASEIYCFVAIAHKLLKDWETDDVMDAVIMQKLLPKLHGSQRKLEEVLFTLGRLCLNEGQVIDDYFIKNASIEQVRYPLSLDKLTRMYRGLINNGFASYAEA